MALMYYMTEIYAGRALDGSLRSTVIRDMRVRIAEVFTGSMLEILNTEQGTVHVSNGNEMQKDSDGTERVEA